MEWQERKRRDGASLVVIGPCPGPLVAQRTGTASRTFRQAPRPSLRRGSPHAAPGAHKARHGPAFSWEAKSFCGQCTHAVTAAARGVMRFPYGLMRTPEPLS